MNEQAFDFIGKKQMEEILTLVEVLTDDKDKTRTGSMFFEKYLFCRLDKKGKADVFIS
ncbi:MAG: hypothetical protein WCX65_05185 [bacterium]